MMRFIASRGKQSQLRGQNWFDENAELSLRMETRIWRRVKVVSKFVVYFPSSTVDLESLSVLYEFEQKFLWHPGLPCEQSLSIFLDKSGRGK